MLLKNLCIAMCALTMTACASLAPPSVGVQPQASLRQPCPDLQSPADGSRAAALRWSIQAIKQYRECQSTAARLVEAVAQ